MPVAPFAPMDAEADLAGLIRAVASGDRSALRAVHDRQSVRLFGVANAILRDRDAAADALQGSFLRVARRAGPFDATRGAPAARCHRAPCRRALNCCAGASGAARDRRCLAHASLGQMPGVASSPRWPSGSRKYRLVPPRGQAVRPASATPCPASQAAQAGRSSAVIDRA